MPRTTRKLGRCQNPAGCRNLRGGTGRYCDRCAAQVAAYRAAAIRLLAPPPPAPPKVYALRTGELV